MKPFRPDVNMHLIWLDYIGMEQKHIYMWILGSTNTKYQYQDNAHKLNRQQET